MKKILFLILTVFLGFTLNACIPEPNEPFDHQAFLIEASGQLDLPRETTTHIELPLSFEYKEKTIELTWYSNKPNVISTLGAVTRPVYESGD